MGIYIKGMEMPETCKLCYLSEFDSGFYAYVCKPTGIRIDYEMAKIDRPRTICPLVPVPPHVRLLNVLKTERECVSRDCDRNCGKCELSLEQSEILSAYDTLISMLSDPAEEGE